MSFGAGREGFDGFCDPVGTLRAAVDGVVGQDPADLVDAELGTDLLRWSRQRDREDAGFAARVLAAVRRGVGVADGYVDTVGWLAWKSCRTRSAIRQVVRLAELAELLPETGVAWAGGEISTHAVELIANARVPGCDEELRAMEPEFLDLARRGDRKRLQVLTQHFKACARADGSKPELDDGLTLAPVGDRFALHGDFGSAAAETIAEAFNAFTPPPVLNDGRTLAVRQAEGFVHLCEVALGRGVDAEGSRPVVSYSTHERSDTDTTHPLTIGSFAGVIDPRERDRILCDAIIVPVTTDRLGQILNVGRATPVWNRAQRRALAKRSPHCQWPGCETVAPWCDAHHFIHWEHGGETSLANGAQLCRRHHTFLHRQRDWTYTFDHQQFRVYRPDGTEVHPDAFHGIDRAA
jgi:hypothetical protein